MNLLNFNIYNSENVDFILCDGLDFVLIYEENDIIYVKDDRIDFILDNFNEVDFILDDLTLFDENYHIFNTYKGKPDNVTSLSRPYILTEDNYSIMTEDNNYLTYV